MDKLKLAKSRAQQVVKANELIEKARLNLSVNQQKLIAYVVSMIKPTDRDLSWYYVSIADFCQLIGIDKKNFYEESKKLLDDLDKKSFLVENEDGYYNFRWFSEYYYLKYKAVLKLQLNSKLKDYLIGLKEQYTQYELWNILALKSKYSIRFYELFKSFGYRDISYTKEIEVDELRSLMMCENYKLYGDLKRRVIEPSINELNEYTDLTVSYKEKKKGNKCISIVFSVKVKDIMDRTTSYYNTIDEINRKNKQIKGQINIMDYDFENKYLRVYEDE